MVIGIDNDFIDQFDQLIITCGRYVFVCNAAFIIIVFTHSGENVINVAGQTVSTIELTDGIYEIAIQANAIGNLGVTGEYVTDDT